MRDVCALAIGRMHDVCALARRARAQRYTSRLISVPLPHGAHRGDRRRQSETRTSWAERYDTGCQWRHAHAKMALEKGPRVRAPRLLCIASPRIPPETRHHPVSASFAAPDARSLVCATARFYYKPPVPRSTCHSPRALRGRSSAQARLPQGVSGSDFLRLSARRVASLHNDKTVVGPGGCRDVLLE